MLADAVDAVEHDRVLRQSLIDRRELAGLNQFCNELASLLAKYLAPEWLYTDAGDTTAAILALVEHYREQSDGSDRLEHS